MKMNYEREYKRLKQMVENLEKETVELDQEIHMLETDFEQEFKLRSELEVQVAILNSQLAKLREPLTLGEISVARVMGVKNLLQRDGSTAERICHEIHRAILARLES
jgi:chromosome segregation ATPase